MGDINVAQTAALNGATAQGTATLLIERAGSIQLASDFDVGQTSGTGIATGFGTATVRNVTGTLTVPGDVDVGQTSGTAGGQNQGTGILTLDQINTVTVGADVDVGQTTGQAVSTAEGTLTVSNVATFTVGDTIDVAKIVADTTGNNRATGALVISNTTANLGTPPVRDVNGNIVTPAFGGLEIARGLVTEAALVDAHGTVTIQNSNLNVEANLVIAELDQGGTNAANSVNGSVPLDNSLVVTRDLNMARRLEPFKVRCN